MKPRSNSPKMSSSTTAEEYASSLSDLTVNSKPLINMLTMLAEENHDHAPAIVAAVEKHLQKVTSDIKLPVLYLIDSIVKNVGNDYVGLFTQNIVTTFCTCFEKVDERTRAQMFKLRQTWNEVFPAKKLYAVDLRVSGIDPAWPITAPPPSIHVNPKFFAKPALKAPEPIASTPIVMPSVPSFSLNAPEPKTVSEIQMRDQLLRKQKELIELQQKKLTLESMQLTARLAEQQKTLQLQTGLVQATHLQQFLQSRPSMPQNADTAQLLELINAASHMSQGSGNITLQQLTSKPASKPLPAAKTSTKPMQAQPKQPNLPQHVPIEKTAAVPTSPVKPVSRVRDPRLAARGLPTSVVQESLRSSPAFESVPLVETAPPKTHITINLGCDNKNNVPNKERRGIITKPRIMSTKARNTGKLSPPTIDLCKGQETSKSKVLQPSSSLSPSKYKIPRSKDSSKLSETELLSPVQKKDENKKGKDLVLKKTSPSKSVSPKKKTQSEKDKTSPKSKSIDKESTSVNAAKSSSPRKKTVDKKLIEPVNNDRTVDRARDRSDERDKYEIDSEGWSPSPPPPPVISDSKKQEDRNKFRAVKISSKKRNYVRRDQRAESRSRSPVLTDIDLRLGGPPLEKKQKLESTAEESVKRPVIDPAINVDATKDVDLRQLPGKRASSERDTSDQPAIKKSKAEMFDVLFGNEDVDLRRLATSQPSPPPPPIISQLSPNSNSDISSTKSEGKKSSSAKSKSSDDHSGGNGDIHPRDWSKFKGPKSPAVPSPYRSRRGPKSSPGQLDRLGRPFIFQRVPGLHNDGRRFSPMPEDTDMRRHSRADPHESGDGNMHLMLAQAQEQLQSGHLTQRQYNTLITSVIKMNEDKKLREAKRRDENWISRRQRLDLSPVSDDGSLADQAARFSPSSDTSEGNRRSPPQAKSMDHDDRFRGPRHAQRGPRFNNWAWGRQPQQWAPRPPGMRPVQPAGYVRHPGNDGGSFGWRPPRPSFVNQMPVPPPFSGDQTRFFNPRLDHFEPHGRTDEFESEAESHSESHPEVPLADPAVLEHIANDSMRTINIDGQPREIRYYGETAVTMVAWNDPREVVFQRGTRRILFDDRDSFICAFNDAYRDCIIDGKQHKVRFGAPTRELYIDNKWYECYFGGPPITIEIDGKMMTVKLEGPPPQVKLGYVKRLELCVGKINLIIDATSMVPIFLDAKPQRFDIDNKPHILRFVNALTTVLINGQPFDVEFGGLPKPIMVRNKKHFIRFSVLPRGVQPGYVNIRNMEGGRIPSPTNGEHQDEDAIKDDSQEEEALILDHSPVYPIISGGRAARRALRPTKEPNSANNSPSQQDDEPVMPMTGVYVNNKISTGPVSVPLDMLTSLLPTTLAPSSGFGYQVEPESQSQDGSSFPKPQESTTSDAAITAPSYNPFLPLKLNIGELFQKLVATGIVAMQNENEAGSLVEVKKDEEVSAVVKPVDFKLMETLRLKQPGMVWILYSGIQCSSCGVRFPPEETVKYSQHLDWHFRQNRRDRDNTRKAQSRKWYYDVSDWIQFEEIEDLEHRAQSWFESQQEATSVGEDNEPVIIPSVAVGDDSENPICEMCHDRFEQFYNEESEEWHLKLAVRVEDKIYHPLCYDDFKASTLLETSMDVKDESKEGLEGNVTVKAELDEATNVDVKIEPEEAIELIAIKKEICDTDDVMETDNTDEIIAIVLPTEDLTNQEDTGEERCSEGESIVATILDDIFESAELQLFGPRVVKLEPEDGAVNADGFEMELKPVEPAADTTHAAVVSSIDGNVQFEDNPQATAAAGSSKIKINITKPIPAREPLPESNAESAAVGHETDRGLSPLSRRANSDEESEPPPPGVETLPEPAKLKPKLEGRQLTILPPVNKGTDLSGLCSIM